MGCNFCTTSSFFGGKGRFVNFYERGADLYRVMCDVEAKLRGIDTLALTKTLQQHGIRVHGSTIVGLDHHTPENIHEEIDSAIDYDADCHQFMLCTPVPGTPLHEDMRCDGRLLDDVDLADIHGQYKVNVRYPTISRDESKLILDWAFRRDYERNGRAPTG